MRRLLILLFVFALPLQFTYGAAARYCAHERVAAVSHFGHHAHVHQKADGDTGSTVLSVDGNDPDCDYCHLGCVQPLTNSQPSLALESQPVFVSFEPGPTRLWVPAGIDRPNWSLAA